MQYPKQSDTTFQSQEKAFKREEQSLSERERVKLEGRNEAEEEHMSQPSTLHSLGNLDESMSPKHASGSMEILQKGFHKTTDTIAQGVEVVKNLLIYSGEKANQAKETVGEKVSSFEGDIKQKAEQAKSKLTEEFGEEIQPEKDLDPEMKEHVKEVNEEIKHHPHGEEQVVEGQGHAQAQQKSFGSKGADMPSQKAGEMKEELSSQFENLKEGSKEMVNKASGKLDEMKEKASQQAQPLKEQAQNLPSKSYEKKEQSGEKDITKFDDLRNVSKDILDKALDKIEEMKDTAGQKGEQVKQDVKQTSSQISEKAEQKASQFSESESQSHHVEAQPGDQPLTKEAKEEILDLAQQITDKVQELKASGQLSTEQKWQSSHFQGQTGSTSPPQEGHESHEHHHLSAESPSFVPTKQSHQLYEKVKEGFEESVPLTEKIEELEHKNQESSSQFQERGQPAMESLKQGAQNISHKISEKVQDIKSDLAPSGKQAGEFKQESYHLQKRGQPLSGQKENLQPQERSQPLSSQIKQGAQEAKSKLSEKVEDVKDKFASEGQKPSEFKQESFQSQERGQPLSSQIRQGAQEAKSKLSEEKEFAKDKFAPSGQKPSEFKQESSQYQKREQPLSGQKENLQSQERRQPLSGQIRQEAQEAKSKLSEKAEDIKDKFASVGQKPSEFKQESSQYQYQERGQPLSGQRENLQSQERGQPFSSQMRQGAQEAKSKLSEKAEDIKDKFATAGQKPSEFKQEFSQYQEREQPLPGQIRQRAQEAKSKLSEEKEFAKDKFAPAGQKPSEFKQEFSQYQERGQPLSGQKENLQYQEKGQPLSGQMRQGAQEAKSKLSEKVEGVKDKFASEGQKPSEFKQESFQSQQRGQPLSSQTENLQYQEKGQPLSDKIKQGTQEASNKLSEKMEDVKNKLAPSGQESSGFKQEFSQSGPQPQEKPATEQIKENVQQASDKLSEKVQEVKQDITQKKEEILEERKPLVDKIMGRIHEVTDSFHQRVEGVKSAFRIEEKPQEEQSQREPLVDIVQKGITDMTSKFSHNVEAVKSKVMPAHHESSSQGTSHFRQEKPAGEAASLKQRITQGVSDIKNRFKSEKGEEKFHKVDAEEGFYETVEEYRQEQSGPTLVSSNPYETLGTKNLTLAQPLNPNDIVGGNLQELTSNVDTENLHLNEGYIYHPTMMEKIKEGFKTKFGKGEEEEEEENVEEVQEGSQSLKQKISGRIESLKGKFHHGKEEVEQQASEKIGEKKPLEKPLETVKQQGKSLKGKAEEKMSESKPFEESLEQLAGASESKSFKEIIGAPFQSIKSKFHHEKEEVQQQASEKISEIKPLDKPIEKSLEQPLEAAKQEGRSLKGKAEEKISESKPLEKPFEQPLEQLIGASESKSFKEVIGAPFQSIKGKFHHEKEEVQQQASEKISEVKPLDKPIEKSLEQPLEAAKQEGKSLKGKAEEKISESKPLEKPFEEPLKQLIGASESKSFKEVIGAPLQSIKGKFHHEKEEVQQQASEKISEIKPDKPTEESLEQPLESAKQEGKSLKEVISAPFQSISGKISGGIGSLKGKFHSGKEQVQEGISQQFGEIQSLDQPSDQSQGQQDSGEFHTVKEGIHETVSELKEEESVEPLVSTNPFEPLESKAGDIAQPLNPQDIVGGDLQNLTREVDQENIEPKESDTAESKSLFQKISGGFHEGLESMKAKFRKEKEPLEEEDIKISEQFNITKKKVISEFTHQFKENMALLGMVKDIEEKCKSSQDEGNENA